ncbi:MAG: ATP-binding protein [Anaerolineae bacterium]
MMESVFIGRRSEMELLDNLWQSSRATFLILYGRRRVGKTRLLTHWLKLHTDRGLYWVAEPTSSLEQLRSFSQALYNYDTPDTPAPQDYTFANWEQAFREVSKLAKDQRLVIFIDEVTYLMAVNPSFIGVLQKAWDQWLSKSNLMLVLSGSQMGVVQRQILAYDAPLYGRATAHMNLPPMPFWTTQLFFPNYSAQDRVSVYAVWGGIPAYWERLNPELPFQENLRRQLLPSNMWMMDEPAFLLKDFVNDPYNYVSILRALSLGAHTSGRIVTRTGLSKSHISSYLATLRDTGFVTRRVPVTEAEAHSRRGRYYVTDPYLRFYYHFLAAFQSKLALGAQSELLDNIIQKLPEFMHAYTWRELCSEWMLRSSARGELPLPLESVGSYWQRFHEIDLVGIDRIERSLTLAACQWNSSLAGVDVMADLIDKTSMIVPSGEEEWTVYFIGFSSTGWKPGIESEIEQIANSKAGGGNWRSAGVRLLDLAGVDADLQQWKV